jgi:hypothetical protein
MVLLYKGRHFTLPEVTVISHEIARLLPTRSYFLLLLLDRSEFKFTCGLFHGHHTLVESLYPTDGGTVSHNMHLPSTREVRSGKRQMNTFIFLLLRSH